MGACIVHHGRSKDFQKEDLIIKSGLYVVECLDAFTFNNGNRNSERVQFILKINNTNAKF